MDGEGNFNWRFVYQFDYFPAEQSLSVKKKEHFWSMEVTEVLLPPVLNLQIWDNDKFTPDDFLGKIGRARPSPLVLRILSGALTLDLNRLYKPAKDAETCSVEIFNEKASNHVSIFEMKQLKGWWPCVDLHDGQPRLTVRKSMDVENHQRCSSGESRSGIGDSQ